MEVRVEVDEFEVLREMTSEELIDELKRRGEYYDDDNFRDENRTKLRDLIRYKTPEETLAFLDTLLFPR